MVSQSCEVVKKYANLFLKALWIAFQDYLPPQESFRGLWSLYKEHIIFNWLNKIFNTKNI